MLVYLCLFEVQFGNNANQVYHALRHLKEEGLDAPAIEAILKAVKNDASGLGSQIQAGENVISRTIEVNKINIRYNPYKLPNGKINIGSIVIPK